MQLHATKAFACQFSAWQIGLQVCLRATQTSEQPQTQMPTKGTYETNKCYKEDTNSLMIL